MELDGAQNPAAESGNGQETQSQTDEVTEFWKFDSSDEDGAVISLVSFRYLPADLSHPLNIFVVPLSIDLLREDSEFKSEESDSDFDAMEAAPSLLSSLVHPLTNSARMFSVTVSMPICESKIIFSLCFFKSSSFNMFLQIRFCSELTPMIMILLTF